MPRPHVGGSTTAKRGKLGKGLASLLLHTYVFRPAPVNRATPLLRRGHDQAFLGRATFLALLPPCREPSFLNLFSALKLSSEAASDSAFKTQFWLNGTEAHRSQMHTCPQGHPATVRSFPAHTTSSQHPLLSTHTFYSPGPITGSWGWGGCSEVRATGLQRPSQAHIHSEIPHPDKENRN